MDNHSKSISFVLPKKSESKVIKQTQEKAPEHDTEYISSLEEKQVKSLKPKEEQKQLIIPLIRTNNWRKKLVSKTDTDRPPPADDLENKALEEIIKDTVKQNDEWETRGKTFDSNLEIPLLMQNQVPEGYETEDHLDVSLRPDEPEDTDYDVVPIEAFGVALLRGMGWKPGDGIGRSNKSVAPIEAVLRPKGMGLGADRKQAQTINDAKKGGNSKNQDDKEELNLKSGAYCLIEKGTHKDLYGMVEGIDEDNARLMVKLAISGKLVTVSQYNTTLVSKQDYNKNSKYINKIAADKYKEREDKKKERVEREDDKNRDSDSKHEKKHRKEDNQLLGDEEKSKRKGKYRTEPSSKKRKDYSDDDRANLESTSFVNGSSRHSRPSMWVRPKLRVRIVDDRYKKGKFYKSKVTIIDVLDQDNCICKTDEGKVLEDVSQSMLETVVPRSDSSHVYILSGKYKGEIAQILERDKKRSEATLQLLSDRDKVVQLDYDSICEYVGNIDEEYDY